MRPETISPSQRDPAVAGHKTGLISWTDAVSGETFRLFLETDKMKAPLKHGGRLLLRLRWSNFWW